jgi:hypothetical protein
VIDADCKSAEYKRLGHFLMPDCKSGRTPNGYQITTDFSFPLPRPSENLDFLLFITVLRAYKAL